MVMALAGQVHATIAHSRGRIGSDALPTRHVSNA